MKARNITTCILAAGFALALAGCGKEKKAAVSEETKGTVQEPQEAPVDETPAESIPVKVKEKKNYLDSVLFEGTLDSETWVSEQTEFTEFSTPLAIGDEIILQRDLPVFKNTSCMSGDVPDIKQNSVVYLLAKAPQGGESGKQMIEFCDEKGNSGWCSASFVQKKYTAEDSIIKKQFVKDGYDEACFSPDGKMVAFQTNSDVDDYKIVVILDRETGEELYSIDSGSLKNVASAFSSAGKYFYFFSGNSDNRTLCQLDTETWEISQLRREPDGVDSIYPLDDGEKVLFVYNPGWSLYDKEANSSLNVSYEDFSWANSFAFSPSGKFIAGSATSPENICVWNTLGCLIWQKYGEYCGELHYSDDSKALYVVNRTGITVLDAETGEEILKHRISFPYHLKVADCKVNGKKDRIVFALNDNFDYLSDCSDYEAFCKENVGSYIYVYELSSGKLVQAERIEDGGKPIDSIALSPDGEYISIKIKADAHDYHQVVCKIDLDKEPRKIPRFLKDVKKEDALGFLLDTQFLLKDYGFLNFYCDGTYTITSEIEENKKGRYELYEDHFSFFVKFSGCGRNDAEEDYEVSHKDAFGTTYRTTFPGTYRFNPDYIDFYRCGAFTYTDSDEVAIPSLKKSPARRDYNYYFATTGRAEEVYKFPRKMSLYVHGNTKMRKEPFLSAEPVYMPQYNEEDRCILYAGNSYDLIGKTMRQDTIDGITAPWYLVWETADVPGEVRGQYVWVFGGFSEAIDDDR